jgi:RimJ/RimL family protein N-acetyltransferase
MEFHTARLTVRHLTEKDAPFILELVNTPGFLQNIGDRGIRNEQDAIDAIRDKYTADYPNYGLFAVERSTDKTLVGSVSFINRDYLPADDVGYAFLPEYFGQGFAIEATQGLIEWAFAHGRQQLAAIVDTHNVRSINLLEKLKFKQDGLVTPPDEETPIFKYKLSRACR